jgi:hypothetical protein
MGKWSGLGQPPTRRKLHRYRAALLKEQLALEKDRRGEAQRWAYTWSRRARGSVINEERFLELWG